MFRAFVLRTRQWPPPFPLLSHHHRPYHTRIKRQPPEIPITPVKTITAENVDAGMQEATSMLQRYWGHTAFRPYQEGVVRQALLGNNTLVITPTGSGKSLCFHTIPLVKGGCALIVSPLISLMEDQVKGLLARGIKADILSKYDLRAAGAVGRLVDLGLSHIYITPEKALASMPTLVELHRRHPITVLAIDEAHCVSEWGHDFRTDYQQLRLLRRNLADVPVMALTATATPRVAEDIVSVLNLEGAYTARTSADRPNLHLSLVPKTGFLSEDFAELVLEIKQKNLRGVVIYCPTKKLCEGVNTHLRKSGLHSEFYHAEKEAKQKSDVQTRFMNDELHTLVATTAFGMGIDKPDIRKVVHYGVPSSMETYYQQVGRAGRDGLEAECVMMWDESDFATAASVVSKTFHMTDEFGYTLDRKDAAEIAQVKQRHLHAIRSFILETRCRRKILLEYFGENIEWDRCGKCDNCDMEGQDTRLVDVSVDAFLLLSAIHSVEGKGISLATEMLMGSKSKKVRQDALTYHSAYGAGKHRSKEYWKALSTMLMGSGHVIEEACKGSAFSYRVPKLAQKGQDLVQAFKSVLGSGIDYADLARGKYGSLPLPELRLPMSDRMKELSIERRDQAIKRAKSSASHTQTHQSSTAKKQTSVEAAGPSDTPTTTTQPQRQKIVLPSSTNECEVVEEKPTAKRGQSRASANKKTVSVVDEPTKSKEHLPFSDSASSTDTNHQIGATAAPSEKSAQSPLADSNQSNQSPSTLGATSQPPSSTVTKHGKYSRVVEGTSEEDQYLHRQRVLCATTGELLPADWSQAQVAHYHLLHRVRHEMSTEKDINPHFFLQNMTLEAIVESKPSTLRDLAKVPGVGTSWLSKWGFEWYRRTCNTAHRK